VRIFGQSTKPGETRAVARRNEPEPGEPDLRQPNKVDHDDNYIHGYGYGIPYIWLARPPGDGEEELTWEYNDPKLEVTFRRGRSWMGCKGVG
jgi:hypothetical protein